jgi:hypothetical protein
VSDYDILNDVKIRNPRTVATSAEIQMRVKLGKGAKSPDE